MTKIKNCHNWDVNDFFDRAMSQNLHVNDFKCVEDIFEFDERFPKFIMKKVMKDISLKLISNIKNMYKLFIKIYHFYLKE